MDFNKWLEKNNYTKGYAHFDVRVSIKDVLDEVQNVDNIKSHSFLPFIHYPLTFNKFSKKTKRKPKIRQLYYSSHYDRCIYQYYSYLLNEKYNNYAITHEISDVAIAYRTNLNKNNIHFAKEAFDYIKSQKSCCIIVGDFKDFFDNLDHKYLKRTLCSVLNTQNLSPDYYAIYKNITKYSFVNLTDLLQYYGLDDTLPNRRKLNKKHVILPVQTLKKNPNLIIHNKKPFGIPQGSAISATLSNIYMINFDEAVKTFINTLGGKYLRYSDDSIFILPINDESEILHLHNKIRELIENVPNLILQTEKTKIYTYSQENGIKNVDSLLGVKENSKNSIDYLGFTFDGNHITIRDKTVSKYFYRTYGKVDTIVKQRSNGKHISCKNLYNAYTFKGAKVTNKSKGNFLSYIKRCSDIFGKNEKVARIIHTHYGKIKKRLKK